MNRIIATLVLFFVTGLSMSIQAQNELCFEIIDTTHLRGHLFILRKDCGECPTFYFIVDNKRQRKQAVNSFLFNSPPPQNQLMLASHIDSRFFALLKIFSEDSLSSRFSDIEVGRAMTHRTHPDSADIMLNIPLNSPLRQIDDLVYLCTDQAFGCTLSLLDLPDLIFVKRKTPMKYKRIYHSKRIPKYEVCDATIDSWGIVVEFRSNCHCFWNDTQECVFLEQWPENKLRLFIPMSKIAY